ncbi:MAG TPA: SRPBCC domain-containing protein [Planctomycetota bacterium]
MSPGTSEKTRKFSRSQIIQATPQRILDALLDLDDLRRWWGVADGLVQREKGGVYALAWDGSEHGYRYVTSGVVQSFLPGRRVRIQKLVYVSPEQPVLGPMKLGFSVVVRPEGTRVSVRQEGFGEGPDWDAHLESTKKGWREALRELKAYLES